MLANCISSLRLLMAPALVYLLWQNLFLWSLLLMLGALITDVADGFVARKLGQVTNVGGLLDHGSDALLVLSGLTVSPPLASFHGLYPFSYSSHSLSMFGTLGRSNEHLYAPHQSAS